MLDKTFITIISFFSLFVLTVIPAQACTSLIVTKGASSDSSVMITYTCDGEFHPHLEYTPAADYPSGDSLEITDWHGNLRGRVAQVEHTYAVVGLMNEHQLAIGETTFGGREDLHNPDGLLNYWDLMQLALERAKTAREAIEVMTELVKDYGYRSTGESFSIADPEEAWIMEMIGPGEGGRGAHWVALKVPDGYISCHANKARIDEFPRNDPENCIYSEDVIQFAINKGYYNPSSGKKFSFRDAYCPATTRNRRWADGRVWSIFRRAAPSLNLSPDYFRGVTDSEPYPLWIKPEEKISLEDVFNLMRDHFEGTDFDMTKGIDAGPYGLPYRWRPLDWTIDSVKFYAWERPISTQQTAFSFVSQSRSWLPDPIGGVYWYGLDDTWFTCYTPLYCGIDEIPGSYTIGNLREFDWESAWWAFNFVSNFTALKYSFMMPDVQAVQQSIEGKLLKLQPAVENTALELYDDSSDLMIDYLTDYSIAHAELAVARWRDLGEYLIAKYNDGYVKNEENRPTEKGYPESWLKRVINEKPKQFEIKEHEDETVESELVD
ncbi:MAG: hypothetical protein GF315_02755 [candidate division Zixibacteria bacterium]|nr:hypothetical protein [candidate division Zixibacteria bacterium]